MTAKGGPFMVEVDVSCRFGRSAKVVSEARIARTGCVHPMQANCLGPTSG